MAGESVIGKPKRDQTPKSNIYHHFPGMDVPKTHGKCFGRVQIEKTVKSVDNTVAGSADLTCEIEGKNIGSVSGQFRIPFCGPI